MGSTASDAGENDQNNKRYRFLHFNNTPEDEKNRQTNAQPSERIAEGE